MIYSPPGQGKSQKESVSKYSKVMGELLI